MWDDKKIQSYLSSRSCGPLQLQSQFMLATISDTSLGNSCPRGLWRTLGKLHPPHAISIQQKSSRCLKYLTRALDIIILKRLRQNVLFNSKSDLMRKIFTLTPVTILCKWSCRLKSESHPHCLFKYDTVSCLNYLKTLLINLIF